LHFALFYINIIKLSAKKNITSHILRDIKVKDEALSKHDTMRSKKRKAEI